MKTIAEKRTFFIAATIAFSAVLVLAVVLGMFNSRVAASAADPLPEGMDSADYGQGGLDNSTVHLAAETQNYKVWTARDHAGEMCVISLAIPEGNGGATCANDGLFATGGLGGSMLVGTAQPGDRTVPMLQTYLLPDGADAKAAAEQIPGSVTYDQLVVRYGPIERPLSGVIEVPASNGTINLMVYGLDSI